MVDDTADMAKKGKTRGVVSLLRPKAGRLCYFFWAVLLQLTTGGLGFRMRRRAASESSSDLVDPVIRIARVSDLNWLSRARTRVWLAAAHGWRTRFAAFDWYVTAEAGGRMVTIQGLAVRMGTIGVDPARLGLVGGLMTRPDFRGHGLAARVMKRTRRLMAEEGCDFGVFFCEDKLVLYYEGLGWRFVPNEMIFERFGQRAAVELNVMVYELAGRSLPTGPIDINGLPV